MAVIYIVCIYIYSVCIYIVCIYIYTVYIYIYSIYIYTVYIYIEIGILQSLNPWVSIDRRSKFGRPDNSFSSFR